jgi:hypothetical protein
MSDLENYNALFIQRQEQLYVDLLRKSIDLEVKQAMLSKFLEDTKKERDEYFNQSQSQVEIVSQATNSIEALTIKTREQEITIKDLEKRNQDTQTQNQGRILEIEKRANDLYTEKNKLIEDYENNSIVIKSLQKEIERQNEEMQLIFDENQKLKQLLPPEPKKTINKKKAVDDSDF